MTTQEPMKCELCKEVPNIDARLVTHACSDGRIHIMSVETWTALQTALIELQREAIKYALWREYDREPAPYKVDDLLRDYLAQRSAK